MILIFGCSWKVFENLKKRETSEENKNRVKLRILVLFPISKSSYLFQLVILNIE